MHRNTLNGAFSKYKSNVQQPAKKGNNNDCFSFLSSENWLLAHAYVELELSNHRIFIEQPQPASQPASLALKLLWGQRRVCLGSTLTLSASAVTILIWVNLFCLPRYLPLLSYYFSCFDFFALVAFLIDHKTFFFFCVLNYPT